MTEQEAAETPEAEIDFKGRALFVRMPTPEQLLVWKRTVKRLENVNPQGWTGAEVMQTLERARSIIDSLLANDTDKDWLDDAMLAEEVTLQEAAQIIQLTVEKFAEIQEEQGNRSERRAAKKAPAKKATRKAATR